jgi:hypothetical protein
MQGLKLRQFIEQVLRSVSTFGKGNITMPATMRVTPDSGLASAEAINFRIGQLRKELAKPGNHSGTMRRINALRLRLPADSTKPLGPAVDASLLISKADLEWEGRQPQSYPLPN